MQNDCSQRAIPATRRTSQHAGHAPAAPLHSADPVVASLREHVKGTEKRLRYHYLWRGITHAAGDKTCTCIFRNYCPSFAHVRRGLQKHFRHERQCKHGRYGHHALSGGHPGHAGQLLEHAHQPFRHAPGAGREPRERVRQTQQRHPGPDQKKRATRFWTPWTHSLRRTQPEPERCWTKSTPPPPGWARCAKS